MAVAEIYERYVPPEMKRKWQNLVRMHHGEAGALMAILGIATNSPGLAAAGGGLMLHDLQDMNKWFKGNSF